MRREHGFLILADEREPAYAPAVGLIVAGALFLIAAVVGVLA